MLTPSVYYVWQKCLGAGKRVREAVPRQFLCAVPVGISPQIRERRLELPDRSRSSKCIQAAERRPVLSCGTDL